VASGETVRVGDADHCEFNGGLRSGSLNANWPDAVLRADRDVLTIHTDSLMDDVRVSRADVTKVRSVRGVLSRGLKFDTPDGRLHHVTYWTPPRHHDDVRDALRQLGWPMD
jgi:hypothetical protein